MSGFDGLETVPDGTGRWQILETGRTGSEGRVATVTGDGEHGFHLVAEEPAPPAGPYASLDEAVEVVAMWRLARFRGGPTVRLVRA